MRFEGSTIGESTAGLSGEGAAGLLEDVRPLERLPALTILAHPDCRRVGELVMLGPLEGGRTVRVGRYEPRFGPPHPGGGQPLADRYLSRAPFELVPRPQGGLRLRRAGCRSAVAVGGLPVEDALDLSPEVLEEGVLVGIAGRILLLLERRPRPQVADRSESSRLVGRSAPMEAVRMALGQVADLDIPVLLRGPSGTGKELAALEIHHRSGRAAGPMVSVNLAALPESLAAAELFGSRRGAFTGSVRPRQGLFRQAHGGTLFLDEVGEASPPLQALLLRAIETREVQAMGAERPERVDVRVVAATDAQIEARLAEGTFSNPLYHRLAGFVVRLPSLRDRRGDLGHLLVHFLRREAERLEEPPVEERLAAQPGWLAACVERLFEHPWPGNVRELRNLALRLLVASRGQESLMLDLGDLSAEADARLEEGSEPRSPAPGVAPPRAQARRLSDDEIRDALRAHDFNLKATATALGLPRTSLYDRIRRSSVLRLPSEIPAEEIRSAHDEHRGDASAMAAALEISVDALRRRLRDLQLD